MPGRSDGKLTVDEIMTRIRQEVARRKSVARDESLGRGGSGNDLPPPEWVSIAARISGAEQHANIGDKAPQMAQFSRPIRWLAKLTGRITLYLTQVITITQRQFNRSITQILRAIADSAQLIHRRSVEQEARLLALNTDVAEQGSRLGLLARELAEQGRHLSEFEERLVGTLDALSHLASGPGDRSSAVRDLRNAISDLKMAVSDLKGKQALQVQRLTVLLQEAGGRVPEARDEDQLGTS